MSTNKQMGNFRELVKKHREEIAYLFFGALTTLINWLTYALLTCFNGEFNKIAAEIIAWCAAVIFAFLTNKFFVFRHKGTDHVLREFTVFLGARAFSGLVEIGGFSLFVGALHFNDWAVKIAISVFVVISNYVLSKFLIFRK